MGHLLSLVVSAGNLDDRKPVYELCEQVQALTGDRVITMFADKGYTGEAVQDDANDNIIRLVVMKKPETVKGFVLLPMRWVVERAFGWMTWFRRLARDFERLPEVFGGLHFVAFGILMLAKYLR
jgi:transposase